MSDRSAISVRGLKVSFGRRTVLDSLDFTVNEGEVIGLLGANGAGKTTLLKSILGLQAADAGRCHVLGESSSSFTPAARARLAYVPQAPGQFPWLTGQKMLKYVSAFYPEFDWDYAHELSTRWKLALRTPIVLLSPGQQQRLSIVRALATRPDVVMLDEPIASLDPATRIAVIDELIRERGQRALSVVFSSHLIGDLERLCSKFAVLAAGKIAVMEEVAWFKKLVRVSLEGNDLQLAELSLPGAVHVRKIADGQYRVLVDRAELERLRTGLPSTLRVSIDEPDVEAVASEWMQ